MFSYFGRQMGIAAAVSAVAIVLAVVCALIGRRQGRPTAYRRAWRLLALGAVCVVATFTIAPIGIRAPYDRVVEWVPFVGGEYHNVNVRLTIENILFNIALFMPLGFCLWMLKRSLRVVTVAGMGISVLVEVVQYATARGTSTTGDVLLNTAGTVVGALLATVATRTWPSRNKAVEPQSIKVTRMSTQ